jgi:hypothetical protein
MLTMVKRKKQQSNKNVVNDHVFEEYQEDVDISKWHDMSPPSSPRPTRVLYRNNNSNAASSTSTDKPRTSNKRNTSVTTSRVKLIPPSTPPTIVLKENAIDVVTDSDDSCSSSDEEEEDDERTFNLTSTSDHHHEHSAVKRPRLQMSSSDEYHQALTSEDNNNNDDDGEEEETTVKQALMNRVLEADITHDNDMEIISTLNTEIHDLTEQRTTDLAGYNSHIIAVKCSFINYLFCDPVEILYHKDIELTVRDDIALTLFHRDFTSTSLNNRMQYIAELMWYQPRELTTDRLLRMVSVNCRATMNGQIPLQLFKKTYVDNNKLDDVTEEDGCRQHVINVSGFLTIYQALTFKMVDEVYTDHFNERVDALIASVFKDVKIEDNINKDPIMGRLYIHSLLYTSSVLKEYHPNKTVIVHCDRFIRTLRTQFPNNIRYVTRFRLHDDSEFRVAESLCKLSKKEMTDNKELLGMVLSMINGSLLDASTPLDSDLEVLGFDDHTRGQCIAYGFSSMLTLDTLDKRYNDVIVAGVTEVSECRDRVTRNLRAKFLLDTLQSIVDTPQ